MGFRDAEVVTNWDQIPTPCVQDDCLCTPSLGFEPHGERAAFVTDLGVIKGLGFLLSKLNILSVAIDSECIANPARNQASATDKFTWYRAQQNPLVIIIRRQSYGRICVQN